VRSDRIGQPLRAIHQHGVNGSSHAASEPAFVHQPKRHRRSDEREQAKFADPDILKSDRDKGPREIAAEGQLLGNGYECDRAENTQAEPNDCDPKWQGSEPRAEG
jgi:hypothetical protein